MRTWKLVSVLAALASSASLFAGAGAAPAEWVINDSFSDGSSTAVVSDLESFPFSPGGRGARYTDRELPGGDPCVDAFGGRANTFLSVNWNDTEGFDCNPAGGVVRTFTLLITADDVCLELYAAAPCRLTSGPGTDDPDNGQYYGARSFRICASDLFVGKSSATRVDFLLERLDPAGVRRGFEIRTDSDVPFTGTATSRTLTNKSVLSSLWKPNTKKPGWVRVGDSFHLPFEITVTVP